MMVKLSESVITALGAKDANDAAAKLAAIMEENSNLKKSMSEQTVSIDALVTRMDALEAKLSTIPDAVNSAVKASMSDAKSEVKTMAEAAASKITVDALASISTSPAKPSPLPAAADNNTALNGLLAQGKFEEAFALLPAGTKAEFMGAKSYAAYMRHKGQVRVKE